LYFYFIQRYITRYNDLLEKFEAFQTQQIEFNKELIQEIRSQREYRGSVRKMRIYNVKKISILKSLIFQHQIEKLGFLLLH